MPKTIKLSWQPGIGNREGRWRKIYRGKAYHFPGGKGKSDREGYDAAWAAWELLKARVDQTAPRKYQVEYEQAIDKWEQLLAWSNRHGDREHAEIATKKLESLRKRFAAPTLSKLDREDWYESLFDRPPIEETPFAQTIVEQVELELENLDHELGPSQTPPVDLSPIKPFLDWQDGSPRRIEKEIWRDRLEVQEMKAASDDQSLRAYVDRYLKDKEHQAAAGEVTVGRHYALKLHLTHFQDWLGKDTAVGEIDGGSLMRYHADLLEKVAKAKWGRTTANHYLTSVKSFVRWLWQIEAIATLPRVLDGRSSALTISKSSPKIVTFTMDEIKSLLESASDRTKLFILLMLNCSYTQKDISDLQVSEVDWNEGRIVRKRSKTADCENVPTVNYFLWPETFRLLQQERALDSEDLVLRNNNGNPIWSEEITKEGKYKKNDNIKNAFDRLRKELSIAKPLKSLKKTSASLLRDNEKFSALASLFLGHAPQSMSDRHYTQVPQRLLDQAVTWLGQEYGLVERPATTTPETAKPDNSAAKSSDPVPAPEPDAAEPAANQEGKARPFRASRRSKAARKRLTATAKEDADSGG